MSSYCRNATHVLPPGTVILLNPEEVHAPGPASSHGWSFRVFFFEDSFFHARSTDFAQSALRFSKPFVEDSRLASSLLLLHRKLEDHAVALDLESSLLAVFAQLAQRHACGPTQILRRGAEKAKVKRVKDYLIAYYGQNITLDDLAAVAQFSLYHLVRTFRRAIGLTPHAHLTQLRIEAAKRLLRMGKAISDVAACTGFTDQSHFTRQFKRITGVTPGQYLPQPRTRIS